MRRRILFEFSKPREKARLIAHFACPVVIRVTAPPIRENHDARPYATDNTRQRHAHADVVLEPCVGKAQILTPTQQQVIRGSLRFFDSKVRISTASHITRGEVEHAGAIAHFCHSQQCAAACLFDIVRMGSEREDVKGPQVFKRFVGVAQEIMIAGDARG